MLSLTNLFDAIPAEMPEELVTLLHQSAHIRIERIVSRQHSTPAGQWYDQNADEYVVVLAGSAGLRIDGRDALVIMKPGDAILLPAHCRHRVEWTDSTCDTIWLAMHGTDSEASFSNEQSHPDSKSRATTTLSMNHP